MAGKPGIARQPTDVFQRRAAWCRSLAAGIDDPEFAIILGKLAGEYEGQTDGEGTAARLKRSISKQETINTQTAVVEPPL